MNNQKYQGPIWPGKPYPLGANWDDHGVNFALFSENATGVLLCLFDSPTDEQESAQIRLTEQTDHVWHAYLPGLHPGQLYGYRVEGPWDPERGFRFNPHKLLIDPYAKAIAGLTEIHEKMFAYDIYDPRASRDLVMDTRDSADVVDKCVVIDPHFDWGNDAPPDHQMHNSVIYETHVKGFTMLHPDIPPEIRGTYKAMGTEPVISHLQLLGITAVELMPIHQIAHPLFLQEKGLKNYWGYHNVNFFAPHAGYASTGHMGEQVREFKEMVKAFHEAGIEVILDVVYNHTAEGNHFGPTFAFKGIDNHNYYRLILEQQRYYMDYTGTGNSLNMLNARTLQMVMDSLRYWVTEMHVDGFRFDLASTLARGLYDVGKLSTFLDTIHQDPIISQVKLIAEPWDIGEGGYQVGNFPVLWAEWNGKYRDCLRRFWKSDESQVAELAYRLSGSSDLYQDDGKLPHSSVNFITAHDGFTMHDLVSYNEKHNEANGEGNRDGEEHNLSWNCGHEGPTDDENIIELRERQKRNLLASLLFSQGVPMISHGDEYGRTQNGNNNVYCQDNELSWYNWDWDERQRSLFEFTCKLVYTRHSQPVMHRRRYFKGRAIHGTNIKDIRWLNAEGMDMSSEEWENGYIRCMGMLLNGELMGEIDEKGRPIKDDVLLVIVNSYWEKIPFVLPHQKIKWKWELLLDTSRPEYDPDPSKTSAETIEVPERSLLLFRKIK